jgi:hypothetical protein
VGLFLWRLQAYPLEQVMPRSVDASKKNFTFNVLGLDEPLFNAPEAETSAAHVAEEINVPAAIRRRAFHAALASYYPASLEVWDNGVLVPAKDIVACDLTDWNRPRPPGKVAVDPVLGRLSFPVAKNPERVRVTYHYGFSDDLGGGTYERESSFPRIAGEERFRVGAGADHTTIQDALDHWNSGSAVIEILDSRTYEENLAIPMIPVDARLEIRAVNEQRPTLLLTGELKIEGAEQSAFELNGLLVSGGTLRFTNEIDRVRILHSTLVPGRSVPALKIETGSAEVTIERSIVGALRTAAETQVEIRDSIVDAVNETGDGVVAAYEGGPLTISRCTVIGPVSAAQLDLAENSLFLHPVIAERRQEGCVRFSHVPLGSRTPRRHRCQPTVPEGVSPEEAQRIATLLAPRFTSRRYGHPGYCQLRIDTPREIRRGAEDESEMGVFSSLRQPQREDALRLRFEEYLRVGLEAGIFFAT